MGIATIPLEGCRLRREGAFIVIMSSAFQLEIHLQVFQRKQRLPRTSFLGTMTEQVDGFHIALLLRMSPSRPLLPAVHFTSLSGATKRFGCLS